MRRLAAALVPPHIPPGARITVAMSAGVDSTVSALLLKQAGLQRGLARCRQLHRTFDPAYAAIGHCN